MYSVPVPLHALNQNLALAFGSQSWLEEASSLTDGTRKKVVLLMLHGPVSQAVLLAWHNEHDYFNERGNQQNALNDDRAPELYRANTDLLLKHGLRVPHIYTFDNTRSCVPYAYALVEYVHAQSYNQFRAVTSARDSAAALHRMREYLLKMHALKRGWHGSVHEKAPGPAPFEQEPFPSLILAETAADLEGLAAVHPGVGKAASAVFSHLESICREMAPREEYSYIHGELGPDEHFLIDDRGEIVVLDVDACQYGDVEREHAYLKLRFGEVYEDHFHNTELDPLRMHFYGLCLHIMASYGHYQLWTKGFPGGDELRQIYEWNAEQVVRFNYRL